MNLKEALEIICKESIPKEINGVRTKYYIEEHKSVLGFSCVKIVICPVHVTNDTINLKRIFNEEVNMIPDDITFNSSTWAFLNDEIHKLLIAYIKKIIEYFDGKVIETRVITVNPFNNEDTDT